MARVHRQHQVASIAEYWTQQALDPLRFQGRRSRAKPPRRRLACSRSAAARIVCNAIPFAGPAFILRANTVRACAARAHRTTAWASLIEAARTKSCVPSPDPPSALMMTDARSRESTCSNPARTPAPPVPRSERGCDVGTPTRMSTWPTLISSRIKSSESMLSSGKNGSWLLAG